MNLRQAAKQLEDMADELEKGIDASKLEEVCAAIKMRIEGTSDPIHYSKANSKIKLEVGMRDGQEKFDIEWAIWDGEHWHEASNLADAYTAWKGKMNNEPQLSLEVVAGTLDPKMREKIKCTPTSV